MSSGIELEIAMRLLFGNRASGIAKSVSMSANRRKWHRRAVRKLLRIVNELDTTAHHRQMLMAELEAISQRLKGHEPSWELVYGLFRLSIRLTGYDYVGGARCHTAIYYQSRNQYYTGVILGGGDVMQDYYDHKNTVAVQRKVVENLKQQGLDDFMTALVLNTTEYKIKQLRSG